MPPTQNPQAPDGYPGSQPLPAGGQPPLPSDQPPAPSPADPAPANAPAPSAGPTSAGSGQPAQPIYLQQPGMPPAPAFPPSQQTPQPAYQVPQLRVSQPVREEPAPSSASPYDFFLDPDAPPKKKAALPGAGGMSSFTKFLIGAGIFFFVMIILAVVLTSLGGKKDTSATGLQAVVQSQQEIIRLSTASQPDLQTQSMQNFAATAVAATTSAQKELVTSINKNGGKVDAKALAARTNAQNDQVLAAAKSASTYDATFKTLMTGLVTDYQGKAQQAHATATIVSQQTLLDKDVDSATLLLQMLSQ